MLVQYTIVTVSIYLKIPAVFFPLLDNRTPDPDPDVVEMMNSDPESMSPDPQHWFLVFKKSSFI